MKSVQSAMQLMEKTDKQLSNAIQKAFPPGRIVKWEARGFTYVGVVESILGFQGAHMRLRVLNRHTGKLVNVSISSVVGILMGK